MFQAMQIVANGARREHGNIRTVAEPMETMAKAASDRAILPQTILYVSLHWLRFSIISLALLIPCFWHPWIMAQDLGSHIYNAWLAQLITKGELPGLVIHPQWTNVLFDFLLSGLSSLTGFWVAEKIAVSIAVLIFFWGTFALICATTRNIPWSLTPCIAMIAYGWIFNMGFFNYYISIGLSFVAIAFFVSGKHWGRFIAIALAPIVALAHPFGIIWLAGALLYLLLSGVCIRWQYKFIPLAFAAGMFIALRYYLRTHYLVEKPRQFIFRFNGMDQLVLFSRQYWFLGSALMIFASLLIGVDLWRRRESKDFASYAIPVQLYALTMIAVLCTPGIVYLPSIGEVGFLIERITLVTAALGCCILGATRPNRWQLIGSSAIAICFFALLYRDTRAITEMQRQAFALVRTAPKGARVMGTILVNPTARIQIFHIVDRACIEQCFSYGNYEPSSRQFRIEAKTSNPYVFSDPIEH